MNFINIRNLETVYTDTKIITYNCSLKMKN